jgi:hypothetical protein
VTIERTIRKQNDINAGNDGIHDNGDGSYGTNDRKSNWNITVRYTQYADDYKSK